MNSFSAKKVLSIVGVVLVCILLSSVVQAQEKSIKLRFASWWSPAHKFAAMEKEWCAEVEKRTNGRVKISHYAGGTLAPPTQVYDSMVKGVFDVGTGLFSYNPGRFPVMEVLDLPLRYRDGVQATNMANELVKKFQLKEMGDMKVFLLHCAGPSFIHTKKKINSINELKGVRIKSSGLSSKIVSAAGGTPVTMPITETYDALAKGLADGLILNMETLKSFKFGDYLKFTLKDHGVSNTTGLWIGMNKKKWDLLPKDVQQIIEKVNEEYIVKFGKAHVDLDNEGEEYAMKAGLSIMTVTKEEEAKTAAKMQPLFDAYVQNAKKKGLPGEEVLNFCFNYLKTH